MCVQYVCQAGVLAGGGPAGDQATFPHGLRTGLVITVVLLPAAVAATPLLKAGR